MCAATENGGPLVARVVAFRTIRCSTARSDYSLVPTAIELLARKLYAGRRASTKQALYRLRGMALYLQNGGDIFLVRPHDSRRP